jgi:hypothetical protein
MGPVSDHSTNKEDTKNTFVSIHHLEHTLLSVNILFFPPSASIWLVFYNPSTLFFIYRALPFRNELCWMGSLRTRTVPSYLFNFCP